MLYLFFHPLPLSLSPSALDLFGYLAIIPNFDLKIHLIYATKSH